MVQLNDKCPLTFYPHYEPGSREHCLHEVKVPNPYYMRLSVMSQENLKVQVCCQCGEGARNLHK
jgi:hypothetical protein